MHYFGTVETPDGPRQARGVGTVEVVSTTELLISYGGRSITVTDPDMDGTFNFGSVEILVNETASDLRDLELTEAFGDDLLGFFGFQTDPDDLASVSTGFYQGTDKSVVLLFDSDGSFADSGTGKSLLSVNFTTNQVSGVVFDNPGLQIVIATASINSTGEITGTLSASQPVSGGSAPLTLDSTDLDARVFGSGAENLAGTFQGNFTGGFAGTSSFVGGFIADESVP